MSRHPFQPAGYTAHKGLALSFIVLLCALGTAGLSDEPFSVSDISSSPPPSSVLRFGERASITFYATNSSSFYYFMYPRFQGTKGSISTAYRPMGSIAPHSGKQCSFEIYPRTPFSLTNIYCKVGRRKTKASPREYTGRYISLPVQLTWEDPRPLISEHPFFKGIEVTLMQRPHVDQLRTTLWDIGVKDLTCSAKTPRSQVLLIGDEVPVVAGQAVIKHVLNCDPEAIQDVRIDRNRQNLNEINVGSRKRNMASRHLTNAQLKELLQPGLSLDEFHRAVAAGSPNL